MNKRIRQRLAGNSEQGFTLIELLVVIIIIGILLAIAVPSYLGFKSRAEKSAAQSNLRAALPAVETYYADNGTYATMTLATLAAIDAGLAQATSAATDGVWIISKAASTYCIQSKKGGSIFYKAGPSAQIQDTTACT